MLRNAFAKGLRDQARPLAMWTVAVAFYVAFLMSIYPSIRHAAGSLQGYINSLPNALRVAFIGPGGDFSSPVGYVNTELLSWLGPIVFIAFAVAIAARALAGEEEEGTLSLILSCGVGRRRLALQKYVALLIAVALLGAAFWLALLIATRAIGTPVGVGELAQAMLRLTLLGIAIGSASYAAGAASGRRQTAIAAGAGLGVAMYLLNTLAQLNATARPLRFLSLFYYSGSPAPLGRALDPLDTVVLAGFAAALLAVTLVLFERRDVRV
jgi:ABC-2 type transport system permease protein